MNPVTLPNIIDRLPDIYLEIKNKLQSTVLGASMNIVGTQTVQDTILKVPELSFEPNATLILGNLAPDFLIIYADVLSLNGPASITRGNATGSNGTDGAIGVNGTPVFNPPGAAGNAGKSGQSGGDGGYQRVPQLFMFVQKVLFKGSAARPSDLTAFPFQLSFDGCNGGRGGDGGRGGNGTDGVRGAPAIPDGILFCYQGPGYGGRGGDAGSGGMPGAGGNGSDGAAIRIFTDGLQTAVFETVNVSTLAGHAGPSGKFKGAGTPGKGGKEGDYSGGCGPAGRDGRPGSVMNCQPLEKVALTGLKGPTPTIQTYTGFDELAYRNI